MDGAKRDAGKVREIAQACRRLQKVYAALGKALPLPSDAPERRAARQAAVEALDLAARSLPLLIDCRARFGYTPPSLWQDWKWDVLEGWVVLLPLTLEQKMQQGVVTSRLYEPFCEEGWISELERWAEALERAEIPDWQGRSAPAACATEKQIAGAGATRDLVIVGGLICVLIAVLVLVWWVTQSTWALLAIVAGTIVLLIVAATWVAASTGILRGTQLVRVFMRILGIAEKMTGSAGKDRPARKRGARK